MYNDQAPFMTEGTSKKSIRDAILKCMSKMINSKDQRLYHSQRRYKKAYDKHVRRPKRFNLGDYVFIDVSPTVARTAEERAADLSKAKLGSLANGPFQVVQVFENVVVVDEDGISVPMSIDRCTRAPPPQPTPLNPNDRLDNSEEPRFVDGPNDFKDTSGPTDLHDDATEHDTDDHEPLLICIVEHKTHADDRVMYDVQMSDKKYLS